MTESRELLRRKRISETWKRRLASGEIKPRRGKDNPRWKGGRIKIKGAGIAILCPDHPQAQPSTGYAFEHLLIASDTLGRPLKFINKGHPDNEEVHHMNGDNMDNRRSNLMICTHSYHMSLHRRLGTWWKKIFSGEYVKADGIN